MKPFDFYSPTTVDEALELLHSHRESVAVVAGGTDLVLELNEHKASPAAIVDLKHIAELNYIRVEDGRFRIGAMTTHAALAADPTIAKTTHLLHDATRLVGSPQIRNLGTIGGNIAQSSVAGDGLAACVTLGADLTLRSVRGERTMNIVDFLEGEGAQKRNSLAADELLTEISFPVPDVKHTATAFYKLGKRKALAISVIAGCMTATVDDDGVCTHVSMRAGALGRYPMHFASCEEYLIGKKLSYAVMLETLPIMHDQILEANRSRPWSVFYKKEGAQGVYKKLFADILGQLGIEEVRE
ncbi:MAG: xanthine dehydrogenase family protein subunit M [Oscillibacter sp.]|nr:xanthine dehydrogenase family protein subunit M [Oscillibacter sp.]